MTFTLDQAIRLTNHYNFLIGKGFDHKPTKDSIINHIVVAPYYGKHWQPFWDNFTQNEDYKQALSISGYDSDDFLVFLVSYDSWSNVLFYEELDNYLTQNNLEKVYPTQQA